MEAEIRTLDALDVVQQWRRPRSGQLTRWLAWVVTAACVMSVISAALGEQSLAQLQRYESGLQHGFSIVLVGWVVATWLPAAPVARLMRVAVLLPIAHLHVVLVAWGCFTIYRADIETDTFAIYDAFPMSAALAVCAVGSLAVAVVVARRWRERLHALVTMTLAHLLVLGLWLPIVSAIVVGRDIGLDSYHRYTCSGMFWRDSVVFPKPMLFVVVLVPAFVVAAAITALVMRRPELARRCRYLAMALLGSMVGLATVMGAVSEPMALVVQGGLVHVVLALVVLAVIALAALGVAMSWRGRRSARGWLAGTIVPDDAGTIVGHIQISSWLRGPRALVRPCTVTTAIGDCAIPRGTVLDASAPAETSALRIGESAVVLRTGDRVVVGGLVEQSSDGDPFRSARTLTAGPAMVIRPASDGGDGFASMYLTLWRPCIAYLAILALIAIPTVIAAIS